MKQQPPPRIDSSDAWADLKSTDIAETLRAAATPPAQAGPSVSVQISAVHGDIINMGSMPPDALAEFLAARRRAR
jgi:hypothetical protein